ncbi:MAG: DedA family protein [Spirochaetaceae bacterium]|jgi:membrane protein DedA with SNARE-associated domain|nr:DedA family protein [Spirochaetaceae bacterium]
MKELWFFISQNVEYFPLAAFICLLLAGFNLPFSEDLIIITGALISVDNKSLLVPTVAVIYAGVVISDVISYWIGTRIRQGAPRFRIAENLITPKRLEWLKRHIDKWGIFTFIICRFIPFGIRNTLFLGSGILGVRLRFFIICDFIAAAVSVNTLFFLVYQFGEDIKRPIKALGIILFIALIFAVTLFSVFSIFKKTRIVPPSTSTGTENSGEANRTDNAN